MHKFIFFLLLTMTFPLIGAENRHIGPQTWNRVSTIIIDPAHGGRDSGVVAEHLMDGESLRFLEKTIVLDIAQILKEHLEEALPDKRITLTREDDVFVSLEDRMEFFNSVPLGLDETAVLISIHTNGSFNMNRRGYELFANFEADSLFTEKLNLEFTNAFGNDLPFLGIKNMDYYVLRNAQMPAIFIEMGHLTSIEDAQLLYSAYGIEKSAVALARWIYALVTAY